MTGSPRACKPPAESRASITTVVMPVDTNTYGNLFGGRLMSLMDQAAFICASRHCRRNCVTVSVDRLDFLTPARNGHIVTVEARMHFVHRSSMEVGVEVMAEDPITGDRTNPCRALFTLVALGPDGRPAEVPDLCADTEEERALFEEGRRRHEARRRERGGGVGGSAGTAGA